MPRIQYIDCVEDFLESSLDTTLGDYISLHCSWIWYNSSVCILENKILNTTSIDLVGEFSGWLIIYVEIVLYWTI